VVEVGQVANAGLWGGRRADRVVSDSEDPPWRGFPATVLVASLLPGEVALEVAGSMELSGTASFSGGLCLETGLAWLAWLAWLLVQQGGKEGKKRERERKQSLGERERQVSNPLCNRP
jgi:hypothetical protein